MIENLDTVPRLVGIGGLKRSGKDTLAEHWARQYGYVVMGMSDPLLEMALVLDPYIPFENPRRTLLGSVHYGSALSSIVEQEGYVKAKEYPEVRAFLQRLGTDVGREMIDQDLWTKQAEKTIQKHWEDGKRVVITGIRFPNEIEMIQRLEGKLLWVSRPEVETGDQHASETSVGPDDFHFTLENNSSLDRLYTVGDFILQRMRGDDVEYPGVSQEARALLDQHGYLVSKPAVDVVVFHDGERYTARTTEQYDILREMERMSREQTLPGSRNSDGTLRKQVLSKRQLREVERGKKQGRVVTITDEAVTVGDFTPEKEQELDRRIGLAAAFGWEAEATADGKVITRHPIDWVTTMDFPKGYAALTRDPHRPLECQRCGARFVNHFQHTRWHEYIDEKLA